MKRIPYHEPLFVYTYTAHEMAFIRLCSDKYPLVEAQLASRYNADFPDNNPTEQEKLWGIKVIDPASAYWTHFKEKLPGVLMTLLEDRASNRAVITIDYPKAPPCFQSFQFKINDKGGLDLICFARSLDLDNGLPVDAPIFWRAALEPLVKALSLKITQSTLTVVSAGAHKYVQD